jgi:uncharacterized protein YecT (DUF1311 family)
MGTDAMIREESSMKRLLIMVAGLVWIASAQAASFDCGKAGTKVEKLICADAGLSKLDEDLNAAYKAALQDEKQARAIREAQKQWMRVRNGCTDDVCVKRAYDERLLLLKTTIANEILKSAQIMPERDKGDMVRKILLTSEIKLRPGMYKKNPTPEINKKNLEHSNFCNTFIEDFIKQKGIEYIEPKVRINDYKHPELSKLRDQCPNIAWAEPKKCNTVDLARWLKGFEGNENAAQKKAEEICATQFGNDKFALYEMDLGDHKEHAFYHSRKSKIYQDELENLLIEPSDNDQYSWNIRTNTVMNVFFPGGGFTALDFTKCRINVIKSLVTFGGSSPESYQALIKYDGHFRAYSLDKFNSKSREYFFVLAGGNLSCKFDVINTNSIKVGEEK